MSAGKPCARPCAGCPWRRENQTPAAVSASPVDGRGVRWFAKANLRRHWRAIAKIGAMLPCHETDVNAPMYGGKPVRHGTPGRICIGVSVLARREMQLFMEAGTNYRNYRTLGGRFTQLALAAWASRFNYAGAIFEIGWQKLRMPSVGDDDSIALPWDRRQTSQTGEGTT